MANSIPLAAIGVKVGYAVETSSAAGTRPTTGYIHIPDIKSTPSLNTTPNTADASTFDNKEFTTYVELLKDLGGALEFNANFTAALQTAWTTMMTAYQNGLKNQSGALRTWFVIDVPDVNSAVFFAGQPSKMGLPEMSANSLIETSVYITPISEPAWESKGETLWSAD